MEIKKPSVDMAKNGSSLVGLSYDSKQGQLTFTFPMGYGKLNNIDPSYSDPDIQTLLRLIYESKKRGYMPIEDSVNSDFPIYEYLYVINYFLSHDCKYYRETESIYDRSTNGKISWSRTIKNIKPTLINNQPFYLETIKRHTSPKDDDLITLINKYCVWRAVELFSSIYENTQVEGCPEIEQYDSEYLISFLYQKINRTNNDQNKRLFSAMISIIETETSNHESDKNRKVSFGTTSFAYIWQDIVDDIFGTERGPLSLKDIFNPYIDWYFRDESGNYAGQGKTASMIPDTINITNNKVYIIDSKNYPFGINIDHPSPKDLPESESLFKQFHYIEYANYIVDKEPMLSKYKINKISPLIIPFDSKGNYDNVLQVRGATNMGDYTVFAVLLDVKYAINIYLNDLRNDKEDLKVKLINLVNDEFSKNKDLYKKLYSQSK